jgi:ribosomal protein S18 acetylase RimI-like enzyme
MSEIIRNCSLENIDKYGKIYAAAFSGEPWNDPWMPEDAAIHVRELLECKQSYGLEYVIDGKVVGFVLGTSMLFHYGRTFEINDLAVSPEYQHQGIGARLLEKCIEDVKEQGIVGIHLITEGGGVLQKFYEKYGFKQETEVILMGKNL